MADDITSFKLERERLQELMFEKADISMKRFLNLDSNVYNDGALDRKTKELMGLVASAVLRCDDCINYHLTTCYELDVSDDELVEALDIALIVGGSITIPHLRRAFDSWEKLGSSTPR
jgi:AhpD family alkylhydroperoxidase